ncbi:DUF6190 family protein [Ferruginivarius sediminum]|uniref:PIN domain-containing protein n=1 Tax=Ferruginivarius sediminum TaxID=2661937 RepID=A0A369TB47_9PROT|nr:DUF6190 family protein [Ferruginivarius sediminum]RDD62082.1 hypothetical protein DRB17_09595 [Ferruginivarius sediminum]
MNSPAKGAPAPAVYIDAGVFLGMNSSDEQVRIASKNLFIRRWSDGLHMTLDQVGICDAIVWLRTREVQDDYYPFMDQLHTLMRIDRVPFSAADIAAAAGDRTLDGLSPHARLMLAKVRGDDATLLSWDPALQQRFDLEVAGPDDGDPEQQFPGELEALYQRSLVLRLSLDEVYEYGTET